MIAGAIFAVSANLLLLSGLRLFRVSPSLASDVMMVAMISEGVTMIAVDVMWRSL